MYEMSCWTRKLVGNNWPFIYWGVCHAIRYKELDRNYN